jgi:glycolate oxidase
MSYSKVTAEVLNDLIKILGNEIVFSDAENKANYAHDHTEDLHFQPEVVIKPNTVEQVSSLMKFCHENHIPVTPRGAGTGLSGGALPIYGGVLLSMERFNNILFIDERNLQVTVEPGVITQALQDTVKEKGLFYPPDPASKGSCFIGGNIAENSGGPKAVKYGVTKDYVLNLEVVLPNGELIWTGANTLKNSTGYNLTQLMVGSEGTLGIVTKIVLKLIPQPKHDVLMLVPFESAEDACAAVKDIFMAGITPSGMEFMERSTIEVAAKYAMVSVDLPENINGHLLIELDGNYPEQLMQESEVIFGLLEKYKTGEILFAESAQHKEDLWKIRRCAGLAVKSISVYKEEDTVVPRAELPILLKGVKEIGKKYGFESYCYGHVGDGNLHVNIVKGSMSDEDWNTKLNDGIVEIFELCVKLGGTISGEHGIGLVQKPFIKIAFNDVQINLMKEIKKVFDPHYILNPGKIFE